ncbi:Prolipoprotein diacylglyceryl transferase [Candidatus Magnetomorum sp. HK-1]|nr:Prolipoprotein diacylglyceryl transferase [Candidatus Magnetomorum sp. HK-1]
MLFEIFAIKVYSYGFATIIACCICICLVLRTYPDYLELNDIVNFCLIALCSMFFADKLLFFISKNFYFSIEELTNLSIQPMHSFYGTLWMAIILIVIYCIFKKIPVYPTLDFLLLNAIPALAIQRIFGCFMAGCCYGCPTDLPWGVSFPGNSPAGMAFGNIAIHPTQLYYGFIALLIYAGLYIYHKRTHFQSNGNIFGLGLMVLSLSYLLISYFRGDHLNNLSSFLFNYKLFSFGTFVFGLMIFFKKNMSYLIRNFSLFMILFSIINFTCFPTSLYASGLTIKRTPYASVKWGKTLTLEIEATNPGDKQLTGLITVSFNSKVIVIPKKHLKLFPKGSSYYNSKNQLIQVKSQVAKRQFNKWLPQANKKIIIKCIPIQTGLLRIFVRAAFVPENTSENKQWNLPDYSTTKDQLGYPVKVCRIFVDESPDFFRNFLFLSKYEHTMKSDELKLMFNKLLDNPDDISTLVYFGFITPKYAKKSIRDLSNMIVNSPQIRQSSDLIKNTRLFIKDPKNSQARKFFNLIPIEQLSEQKNSINLSYKEIAKGYIMSFKCGNDLIQMIESDGDIFFESSGDTDSIAIRYQNQIHTFKKTSNIVYDIVMQLVRIKPNSQYNKIVAALNNKKNKTKKRDKDDKSIYVTFLNLFEPIKKRAISSELNINIQEIIFQGIMKAISKYPFIRYNEWGHTIENTPENLDKMISITLNPHKSPIEKKVDLTKKLMIPNDVDAILSGILFIKEDLVDIRLYLFLKTNKVIQRSIYFQKNDFFCGFEKSSNNEICKKVFENISNLVVDLFDSL